MRVCIVGASGKLGRYMVNDALDRGYDVVAVCRERASASSTPTGDGSRLCRGRRTIRR